jgi:trk system potassium uptake protein
VSMIEIPLHEGWMARPLREFEDACGARVAYLMRFGIGTLPSDSMVLQEGDQVFMLLTDDLVDGVNAVGGSAPAEAERV